jgi:DNA-binding MarR family transcriptional regulator
MAETRKPESGDDEQLLPLFRRAAKWLVRGHRHLHRGHRHLHFGHHAQGHVLAILGESENISQRELLELLHVRSASLSELLIKLEKKGAIVRRRSEKDRRNFLLQLTEQGRAELAEHRRIRQQSAGQLFSVLSDEERETLAALLTRLVDAWEAEEKQREDQEETWGRQISAWLRRKVRQ